MRRSLLGLAAALLILFGVARIDLAQEIYGTLSGTVTDSSGAVVQNAAVTRPQQRHQHGRSNGHDRQQREFLRYEPACRNLYGDREEHRISKLFGGKRDRSRG